MELKYLCGKEVTVRKVSSNRTFMELKLGSYFVFNAPA